MFELKKIDPFRDLTTIQREMNDFFRKTFGLSTTGLWRKPGEYLNEVYPEMDCYMKGGKFIVNVDLPGIDPKDVNISVTGNLLTIKGERRSVVDEKKEGYLFHETSFGRFERSLTLPDGVDTSKIHASCSNGVLELTMPAKTGTLPKKVTIEIESGERKEEKKVA